MMHTVALTAAAAAILLALPASAAGLYPKSSAVLQVDAKNYDRLIAKSNHVSIVEFYAPWCGHCKSLQPQYERAAKGLAGLAKVAAINCDEEENKAFCGGMGVQGFPTLKIVRPGKKPGSPVVEDYQGPREAKEIIDAVVQKIPNHVKKITDKDIESFLAESNDTAKAILFTEKGTTSALWKAVAIDFLGSITVGQARNKEAATVEKFGVTKFPTIVLLPGGPEAQGKVYDGEIKKEGLVKFFSQIAEPNPDPAPAKVKMPKSKSEKKAEKKDKESFESVSSSQASSEGSTAAASATSETIVEPVKPSESPVPGEETKEDPVKVDPVDKTKPPIPYLVSSENLGKFCLDGLSGTCVLAFVPGPSPEGTESAFNDLIETAHKHNTAQKVSFPFFVVPEDNKYSSYIRKYLGLSGDVDIVAINAKKGWWMHYNGDDIDMWSVRSWVDGIKVGDGEKLKINEPHKFPIEQPEEKLAEHDEL